ncbi:MAG: iron-containing alcohol dehydrogenase [Coriobacteriia bacterium]|nr:iron-containing alcohol dehydrogenase [Coriobacteriia bacterium]
MSYTWNLPTKVLFGPGKVKELANEEMPGKKALLVISCGKSVRENGALAAVEKCLTAAGAEYVVFDKIQSNPLEPTIMEGVECARQNGCDFVVGLGGGSVLDSATVISAVAPQVDGRVWDYVQGGTGGGRPLAEKPLPYIEITTSAGTGSEVDCWGVVTNPQSHEKIGFQGGYPELAVVDPELMLSVPPTFTAYQGFDALFHSVEGYLSKFCNEAAEMFELAAIRSIAQYLPRAVRDGSDLEARTKVAFANTMSGYSMEVCSCVSQHAMEHALSGHHQELPHGAGLIMISKAYFGRWIDEHVCDERFIELARALGRADARTPEDFLAALSELMEACGVDDLRMSDYGIEPQEFAQMAVDAKETMGVLFFCDRFEMSDEDVVSIYEKSYR